jgi:truncated hemoglobin YjbI
LALQTSVVNDPTPEAREAAIAAMKEACERSALSPEEKARVMAYLDRMARDLAAKDKGSP